MHTCAHVCICMCIGMCTGVWAGTPTCVQTYGQACVQAWNSNVYRNITGSNLGVPLGDSLVKCLFGGVVVNATVDPPSMIVCVAPSMTSIGPKLVEVTLNGVDKHSSPVEYTYYNQASPVHPSQTCRL